MSARVLKNLNRPFNRRRGMIKSLANDLIMYEKVDTTLPRAKATQSFVEKLITKAKTDSLHSRRLVEADLGLENTVKKMFDLIGPKFKERPGGYTRITKLGHRAGDNSVLARLEFTELVTQIAAPKKEVKVVEKKKAEKITVKKTTQPKAKVKDEKTSRAKKTK